MARKAKGVSAVDRAISILKAFNFQHPSLTLHELAERTGLYKSTILRLLESLISNGCVIQRDDGRYQLGSMLFHWGSLYQASLRLEDHVTPILRKVVAATDEDVSFFKRVGKSRVVLFHEPSPHPVRIHLHVGALLPLDSGAAGRVLELFDGSRKRVPESPLIATFGDRKADIAAIAVPIFGHAGTLEGALSVSGPVSRFTDAAVANTCKQLIAAGVELTQRLGGDTGRLANGGKLLDYSQNKRLRLSSVEA